jgi:membrane protein DedA with SNARE-associated domain
VDDFAQREFPHLLAQWGYAAILLAIIADSLGVPIPGEIMLLLASIYAGATHHLSLPLVIGAAALGAVLGDNVTYTLGRRGGYPLLRRHGRMLHLGRRRLKIGQYLFRRYGGAVVWAGRFIPVLHIWTAVLAGVNRMPWPRFALANAVGAVGWAACLALIGFGLGRGALRFGGFIAGASVPIALLIAGMAVFLLRANEERLYVAAERALGNRDDGADERETRAV